jgi:hypothetical protein
MKVEKGASIHKQPGNPNWFASFSIYNAQTNRWQRVFRSTYTRNEEQARQICRTWHKAALKAYDGKLSVDAAREIIAQGVSDIFMRANAESMPSESIKAWCETWLKSKAIKLGDESSTHERYKRIVERFIEGIGTKADRDLSMLQPSDIAHFRDREARERTVATANPRVKVPYEKLLAKAYEGWTGADIYNCANRAWMFNCSACAQDARIPVRSTTGRL